MSRIFLCSFSSSSFQSALKRLQGQAEQTAWFNRIFCFTEKKLSDAFKIQFHNFLSEDIRGFGYWIWKPQILLQCLSIMDDGDILLYMDAGCHLNKRGKKRFLKYVHEVEDNPSGFLVFGSSKNSIERQYTKQDLLAYMGVKEDDPIYDSGQIHATAFFVRKSDRTVEVIKYWRNIMINHISLIDDSPSILPNAPDFVENRHDQSVFSILMKKECATVNPITHIWSYTWAFMFSYPIWAMRSRGKETKRYPLKNYAKDFILFLKNKLPVQHNEFR